MRASPMVKISKIQPEKPNNAKTPSAKEKRPRRALTQALLAQRKMPKMLNVEPNTNWPIVKQELRSALFFMPVDYY